MNNMIPFSQLIREAQGMLLDRERIEADLIYAIAIMPDESRHAIVMAYRILFMSEDENGGENE
jgi:hypothetical protein